MSEDTDDMTRAFRPEDGFAGDPGADAPAADDLDEREAAIKEGLSQGVPQGPRIHGALHDIKAAMALHGIAKGRKNSEQNYQFRGIDEVLNTLSAEFVRHRVNVYPEYDHRGNIERKTSNGKPQNTSIVQGRVRFVHVDDASEVTITMPGEGADIADKSCNKAISASFKYGMLLTFVIPTKGVMVDLDDDNPRERDEPQQERQQRRDPPPRQEQRGRGREEPRQDRGRGRGEDPAAPARAYLNNTLLPAIQALVADKMSMPDDVTALLDKEANGIARLKKDYPAIFREWDHELGKAMAIIDDVPF